MSKSAIFLVSICLVATSAACNVNSENREEIQKMEDDKLNVRALVDGNGKVLMELPPDLQDLSEPDLSLEIAERYANAKTEAQMATWQSDGSSWAADLEKGTITFVNDREWQIVAPVQVVGTFNTNDGTWLWGWDHPSVAPEWAKAAMAVKSFGQKYDLEGLTTRKVELTEDEAWQLTALAAYLTQAEGVYRGPSGSTHVFFTFGDIEITKPEK